MSQGQAAQEGQCYMGLAFMHDKNNQSYDVTVSLFLGKSAVMLQQFLLAFI